jgi:hypothetical protein
MHFIGGFGTAYFKVKMISKVIKYYYNIKLNGGYHFPILLFAQYIFTCIFQVGRCRYKNLCAAKSDA